MSKRRWSDNDRHFGPFLYARSRDAWRPIAIVLDSGADENPGCSLRVSAFGHTVIADLPAIIRPWRKKIYPQSWDAATVERLGRDYYWDEHPREYGFSLSEGFLQIYKGAQTHDSSTTQSWSWFLPWTQWRHVRHSLYDRDGNLFYSEHDDPRRRGIEHIRNVMAERDRCPSASFEFDDYDGERIVAKTCIEEREWRLGEGWFKWLSVFRKSRIERSLDIEFSKETGPRKGSWKGGTLGHGIEMRPGELHEDAFRRYCTERKMTFISQVAA